MNGLRPMFDDENKNTTTLGSEPGVRTLRGLKAAAVIAALVVFGAADAYAQPFLQQTGVWVDATKSGNPANGFNEGAKSTPSFVDLDGDGDYDMVWGFDAAGASDGLVYYKNTGDDDTPTFVRQTGAWNNTTKTGDPFSGVVAATANSNPIFVDLDSDGDQDLVLGNNDEVAYYRNDGNATSPNFVTPGVNPFSGVDFATTGRRVFAPAYADFDDDGDYDFAIGVDDGYVWYAKNTGTPASPAFTLYQNGVAWEDVGKTGNPFKAYNDFVDATKSSAAVDDILETHPCVFDYDGDGDYDLLAGAVNGQIWYFRNSGDADTPTPFTQMLGASNPFDGVDVGASAAPVYADLDDDADLDIFIGRAAGDALYYRNDAAMTIALDPVAPPLHESTLDGAVINLVAHNGRWADGFLDPANFTLNNAPIGAAVASVTYVDPQLAQLTIDFSAGADFDADYTNFRVTADAIEVQKNVDVQSDQKTIQANNDAESISVAWANPPGTDGNEMTLADDKLVVTLTGGTFNSAGLNSSNVYPSGAATTFGVTFGTITLIDLQTIEIEVNWSGLDFDADQTLTVNVATGAYRDNASGGVLQGNTTVKAAYAELSGALAEGTLDGSTATMTLTNMQFVDGTLNPANFRLFEHPTGMTVSSVSYTSPTQCEITFAFDGTDFDADKTLFYVEIDDLELVGNADEQTLAHTITATNDVESISAAWKNPPGTNGQEAFLNDEVVRVTLTGGTFIAAQVPKALGNVYLTGDATGAGVTIESVTYVDHNTIDVALAWNDTDIATDKTLTINVDPPAYNDDILNTRQSTLIISASTATLAATGSLTESDLLDGESFNLTLTNVTFTDGTLDPANFEIVAPTYDGLSVTDVTYLTPTTATITIRSDTTDFDTDFGFSFIVKAAEIQGDHDEPTNSFTALADAEGEETPSYNWANPPGTDGDESTLNDEIIDLTMLNGSWVEAYADAAYMTFTGDYTLAGISVDAVYYVDKSTLKMEINHDGTELGGYRYMYVTYGGSMYDDGNAVKVDTIVFGPTDVEIFHAGLTESNLDGAIVPIKLTGATWADPTLNAANFTAYNLPDNCTFTVTYVDSDSAYMTISYDGTDFDTDIPNFFIDVPSGELSGGQTLTSNELPITAVNDAESLNASWRNPPGSNGAEGLLDDEVMRVTVSGGTLIQSEIYTGSPVITFSGDALVGTGVTIESVTYVNPTTFDVALAWDGTDIFMDKTLNVELGSGGHVESDGPISSSALIVASSCNIYHPGLTEENLHGANILIELGANTWVDGTLAPSSFALNNAPAGASVASVTWLSATEANIEIDFDPPTDFDVDITNFSVTVAGSELSSGAPVTSNTLLIDATNDPQTLSIAWRNPPGTNGAETTLNSDVIRATLSGGTWASGISDANVTVSGAAADFGVTVAVGGVTRIDATTVDVQIAWDGTDFDLNKTLTLVFDENSHDAATTSMSDDLTIVPDPTESPETISLAWENPPGVEADMDSENILVTITDGTFDAAGANPTNVTASGTAVTDAGVTIAAVTYVNATTLLVDLAWDGTDYDVSKTLQINVGAAAYDEGTTTLSNTIILTPTVEPISATLTPTVPLTESNLNGATATLTVQADEWADGTFNVANFPLSASAPAGLTINSITYVSATEVTLTFAYPGTDFDASINDFNVTINAAELTGSISPTSNDVTITATVDNPESVASAWRNPPGTGGVESTLNNEIVRLTLANGTFVPSGVNTTTITASGTAVTDAGVTIGSATYVDATTVDLAIDWSGVDFDVDKTLTISVSVAAYEDEEAFAGPLTTSLTVTAEVEPISARLYHADLSEATLDGASVYLYLRNDVWTDATLLPGNFTPANLPTGATYTGVTYENDTTAILSFSYDGTDFDADVTDFNVTISAAEIASLGTNLTTEDYTIRAINDAETVSLAWRNPPGTNGAETTLNNEVIRVTLSGGEFNPAIGDANVTASGTATTYGVSLPVGAVTYVDPTTVDVAIDWDGTDFDAAKTLTLTFDGASYHEGSTPISGSITTTPNPAELAETISLAWQLPPDVEANMNNENLLVTLTDGTFTAAQINLTNVTASGTAVTEAGISINTVTYVNSTTLLVDLSWDYTDYDVAKTLQINVAGAAYAEGTTTLSNTISLTPTVEPVTLTFTPAFALDESNLNGATATLEVTSDRWQDASFSIPNFTLSASAPAGLAISSIAYENDSTVTLTFTYPGTDIDAAINDFNVTIAAAELQGPTSPTSNNVTITATADNPESVAGAWRNPPGTGGVESSLNNEVVRLTLTNGTFVSSGVNTTNITATGTAVTDAGVSIESVTYVNLTTVDVAIDWPGVDFDVDKTLTINVDVAAYEDEEAFAGPLTTSLTVTAQIEPVTASLYHADLSEATLDGAQVYLYLHSDRWTDATLAPANFTPANLPPGASMTGVAYENDTTAILTFAFDGTDFDADITDFNVTIAAAEMGGVATDLTSFDYTIRAINDAETLSLAWRNPPGTNGAEVTLNADVVRVTLNGGTFNSSVGDANVTASGTATTYGVSLPVGAVTYVGPTTVDVAIDWDGTDFDVAKTLTLTFDGASYTEGSTPIFGNITTAPDPTELAETISLAWQNPPDVEANMNNEDLLVTLTDGTFTAAQINLTNVTASGTAVSEAGISINTVTYVDPTTILVDLSWDYTDYDVAKTLQINVAGAAYDEGTATLSNTISLTPTVEPVTVTLTPAFALDESNLNAATATLEVTSDRWVDASFSIPNFTLSASAPDGLTISSITYENDSTVTLLFSYPGTDIDAAINDFNVTIAAAELQGPTSPTSNDVTITATADNPESVAGAWRNPPGTGGVESSLNNEVVRLTLTNGTFVSSGVNTTNITATGTAVTDAGVSIESVTYLNPTTVDVAIDWPGVDFDVDKTLTINVDVAAYEDEEAFAGPLTTSLTVTAQIEPVTAELYHADLSEESLDTANIILYLHSDRWADATLDHTLFTATNLPTGASLAGVTYVNDTTATLDVTYDGTDFDADITDFNVTIPASEIDFFGSDVISADYTIRAIDEGPETLAAAWATVPGTNGVEPTIDGDAVTLTLTNGTFVASQVNLITIPASVTTNTGVSIESIAFVDTHTVRIELQHDGVTDYDVDEVMTFTLPAAAYEEGSIDLTASITLVATLEPIYLYLTSAPALDEVTNLDGATIDLELSSGTWIDATLEIDSLILGPTTPLGVTATAFTYVDPTHATVTLAYDGTDFDHDVTDFYLTVDKNQVVSAPIDVVSDSLTITALEELGGENLSLVWSAGSTGAEADDPNDDELTATLAGGTLIASALTTANVTLSGDAATAAGVTIESVTYVDPTTFTVAIDWDGTDFDVDKTLTVTLSLSAYRDSDPDGDLSASETMTATDEGPEALSVAYVDPANGQEDLIDQAVIEATLTNGTFIQSQITLANITPSGTAFDDANITFEAPIYVDLHTIRVPVQYDGAIDFDFDKILTLNVAAAAYAEGSADLSGDLTVTAIQEPVSLFAAATPSLTEENLHTATVTLELDDDVWADGVIDAATNAKLLNAPAGLTIAAITWIDDTHAEMTFNFTGRDFDTTVTDMRVQIEAPELFAWPDSVISTPLTITPSTTETDEFITLAWANPPGTDGAEATLDADAIIVDIGGGTFNASETDLAYFVASGTAVTEAGVTLESVTFVDTHKVRIEVSWDGTDFDVAKTLTIRVAPPAYGDGTDTLSANITITPTVEPVLVVISHPTGLSETQLDTVFVELISETWADATLDPSNFLLNNRPLGVGVERVDYVDPTHAKIVLDYDGTDFDSDITNFNVTVRDDEFTLAGPDVTSNNLTITAIADNPETISLAWTQAGMGVEENLLRNDTLRVTLANGTFFESQATLSNVNESGDAVTDAHVYLDGVIFVDDKTLLIPLTLIDSVDFDADKTLTITIDADAYNEGTTDLTASIPIIHSAETATVSITPIGVAQLTEGNVANRPVAIKLNSDTWAGGAVNLANFTLNGAPPGVTLASVFYVDADSAYGVLAFDGTDFDSDYSIDVTVAAAQTTSSPTDVTSNSLTILANADAESISISFRDPPGTNGQKSTIDAEVLVVTISGGTFDAANIDLTNVLGSGEATTAAGVSLEAATYVDKHTIHIPLAWDGTDYTTDVTLDIEILAPGYDDNASGSSLTASVVLPVDPAITISHPTGLTESNIVATSITLSVANDQFADATLNKANFTAINAPTGLAIDSVVYVDARTATVYLSYPGYDFDVDYPDFAIVAAAAEFTTTTSSLESNALPIVADPGAETLALEWSSPPGTNGLEATMDGEVILAILTEGTFVKTQMKNLNFVASGDATSSGVGVESVAYVSADTVAISITWDGTDYDVDKTLTITLQPAAYQDGDAPIPASITLPATIENATAILSANPTLHEENNLDGANALLELTFDQFVGGTLALGDLTLVNAPEGLTISGVSGAASDQATLTFAYGGKDFDADVVDMYVEIAASALVSGTALDSDTLLVEALDDDESFSFSFRNGGAEAGLADEFVIMEINGGTFEQSEITLSNFAFSGDALTAAGISIVDVAPLTDTTCEIEIAWDTTDFDVDRNLVVEVRPEALIDRAVPLSGTCVFPATDDPEILVLSWRNPPGFNGAKGSLDSDALVAKISGGSFIESQTVLANFTASGTGFTDANVTIEDVIYVDKKTAYIPLSWDGTDYLVDKTLTITADAAAYDDEGVGSISDSKNLPAAAAIDVTAYPPLNEWDYLDGAEIEVNLVNVSFDGPADKSNFVLNNAPPGVEIDTVIGVNPKRALMRLAYDGLDFDVDYPNVSITVLSAALFGSATDVTSNTLAATAKDLPELISLVWATPPGTNGAKSTMDDEVVWLVLHDDGDSSDGDLLPGTIDLTTLTASGSATLADAGVGFESATPISLSYTANDTVEVLLSWTGADYADSRRLEFNIDPSAYAEGATPIVDSLILLPSEAPIVQTTTATLITATSAQSGGDVISDGGATVTDRGVVWSDQPAPTMSDNIVTSGSGSGAFTADISGLLPGTRYYARAYATNALGTTFGEVDTILTVPSAPVALSAQNILSRAFTAVWTANDVVEEVDGYALDISTDPLFANYVDGFQNRDVGSVSFYDVMDNLVPITNYFYRVRARNESGLSEPSNVIALQTDIFNLSVTSPNGGETWLATKTYDVTWTSVDIDSVMLEYSTDAGATWALIVDGVPADYVGASPIVEYDLGEEDKSGEEGGVAGATPKKKRASNPDASDKKITLTNSLTPGSKILAMMAAGSYRWTVPAEYTTDALVRVTEVGLEAVADTSDAVFEIAEPVMAVTSPNGGETWRAETTEPITWTTNTDSVAIDYSIDGGSTWTEIVASIDATLGSYDWTIPLTATTRALVRVRDVENAAINDVSDAVFTILPAPDALVLTSPNGGEYYLVGKDYPITWTSRGVDSIRIDYSTDGGSTWATVVDSLPANFVSATPAPEERVSGANLGEEAGGVGATLGGGKNGGKSDKRADSTNVAEATGKPDGATGVSGTFLWTVPNTISADCYARIVDIGEPIVADTSDGSFEIATPMITLTAPNGGETWRSEQTETILFTTNVPTVTLDYSTDAGVTWTEIIADYPATSGTYAWTLPNAPTTTAMVRASDAENASLFDVSDAVFEILRPFRAQIVFEPDSLGVFVATVPNTTTKTTWMKNAGDANLNVDSISSNNTFFTVAPDSAFMLVPGDSLLLTFAFSPTTGGDTTATMSFYNDIPETPVYPKTLYGEALQYPDNFTLNHTYYYDANESMADYTENEYQLAGLPGDADKLLTTFLDGEQSIHWEVVRDNGVVSGNKKDYYVFFDGSEEFKSMTGRAFWVLHNGDWILKDVVVPTAPLNAQGEVAVPLATSKFMLLANPFVNPILWSEVQRRNDITQPLNHWDGTNWTTVDSMQPFVGYVFDNRSAGVDTLYLPYALISPNYSAPTIVDSTEWRVGIEMRSGVYYDRYSFFGVASDATYAADEIDHRKPRGPGEGASIYFSRADLDADYSRFAVDMRPMINDLEEWPLVFESSGKREATFTFDGVSGLSEESAMYLLDLSRADYQNLREDSVYVFDPTSTRMKFAILAGDEALIQERIDELVPKEFELMNNYPNPFNPYTRIAVKMPEPGRATLTIYNILGEVVTILHDGELEQGVHHFKWNGVNEFGVKAASGVYFYNLRVDNKFNKTKKMVMIK